VSTAPQSTELLRQMNTSALVWHHVNAPDSLNLSHYLLDTYNSHVREIRMGAGAVADTIFLNVHVGNAQSPARGITVPALLPAENGVLAAAVLGCSQSRPNAAFDLLRLVNRTSTAPRHSRRLAISLPVDWPLSLLPRPPTLVLSL